MTKHVRCMMLWLNRFEAATGPLDKIAIYIFIVWLSWTEFLGFLSIGSAVPSSKSEGKKELGRSQGCDHDNHITSSNTDYSNHFIIYRATPDYVYLLG
jgi:hypothetical protein